MYNMISIITATYNRCKFLPELLNVVSKSKIKVQHVLVDNLSDDGTQELVSQYQNKYDLLYIREKTTQTQALNLALKNTKYPWIGWVNSDDYYADDGIEILCSAIKYGGEVSYGGMLAIFIDENNRQKYMPPHTLEFVMQKLHTGNRLFQPTVLLKKQFLIDLGGWDPQFEMAQDYWLWAQTYMRNKKFVRIDKHIATLRAHSNSLSVTKIDNQRLEREKVIQILKKHVKKHGLRTTKNCVEAKV
jgi:hypothetical protein